MMSRAEIVRVFRLLGADAERWPVDGDEEEGRLPEQLARFLVLRAAWKSVVDEDGSWIEAYRRPTRRADDPLADVAGALERILAAGSTREDVTIVVRALQYETLFGAMHALEDPSAACDDVAEARELVDRHGLAWGLFLLDERGRPKEPIGALHEDALGMDPAGREMRPKNVTPR